MNADDLKAALQRARRQPMQFAAALGKQPQDHQLLMHHTRSARLLAKDIREQTGLKLVTWGVTEQDDGRRDTLVLAPEGKVPAGLTRKLQAMLKLMGAPVRKVVLKVNGQELCDDEEHADQGDETSESTTRALITQDVKQVTAAVLDMARLGHRLAPQLQSAAKDVLLAMKGQDLEAAERALATLKAKLTQAEVEAKTLKDLADLDRPDIAEAYTLMRQLQDDPLVQAQREDFKKRGASVQLQLQAARQARKSGDLAKAEQLQKAAKAELKAARQLLESYWPKLDKGAVGSAIDWAPLVARLDLSSPKDLAVFWSGDVDAAIDIAAAQGGVAMESTPGGTLINGWTDDDPDKGQLAWCRDERDPKPPPYRDDLWRLASATYAQSVEGQYTIVQTKDRHPHGGYMWRNVEQRILNYRARRGEVINKGTVVVPNRAFPHD